MRVVKDFPYKKRIELLENCLEMQIAVYILHLMSEYIGGRETEELCEDKAEQLLEKINGCTDRNEVTKIIIEFLEEEQQEETV